ncbi:UNVERIFIED_CONTAM: hypothetical protein FKN15_063019 [Acipenser sinensis]
MPHWCQKQAGYGDLRRRFEEKGEGTMQKMLRELAFAGEYRKLGQTNRGIPVGPRGKGPRVGCGERDELQQPDGSEELPAKVSETQLDDELCEQPSNSAETAPVQACAEVQWQPVPPEREPPLPKRELPLPLPEREPLQPLPESHRSR